MVSFNVAHYLHDGGNAGGSQLHRHLVPCRRDCSILAGPHNDILYFQYNNEFYEMVDGVTMGRPLSPVVANFFTEKSEW